MIFRDLNSDFREICMECGFVSYEEDMHECKPGDEEARQIEIKAKIRAGSYAVR